MLYVSIHATLAGGDESITKKPTANKVSIHATLAGGDASGLSSSWCPPYVSIHATLAGGDPPTPSPAQQPPYMFLSTPPSRVATDLADDLVSVVVVSIHATLAGGDPRAPSSTLWRPCVSIHATLAGGDGRLFCRKEEDTGRFYPRHPRGWRLVGGASCSLPFCVSIHATLAGGDVIALINGAIDGMFLSTPPSRVATMYFPQCGQGTKFLSTPPSRVATRSAGGWAT